jgi:hypothetical protein
MLGRFAPVVLLVGCAAAGTATDLPPDSGKPPQDSPLPQDSMLEPDAPPDTPPVDLCASAATCQTAILLGETSGDTGNTRFNTSGFQSAWFRVRVTENDEDFPGLSLRFGAKLTSPASNDYDVFVYVNTGSDVVECSTTTGTTTTNGTVNENLAEWGEGTIPNGSDDDRTVSVEIRPIGTNCQATAPWQLEVQGNWL